MKDITEPCTLDDNYADVRSKMVAVIDGLKEAKVLKHHGNKTKSMFTKSQMFFNSSLKYFEVGGIKEKINFKKEAAHLYEATIKMVWYCYNKFKEIDKKKYINLAAQCTYYFSRRFLTLKNSKTSQLVKDTVEWDDEIKTVAQILSMNFEAREKLREIGILEAFEKSCSGKEVEDFLMYLRKFESTIEDDDSGDSD